MIKCHSALQFERKLAAKNSAAPSSRFTTLVHAFYIGSQYLGGALGIESAAKTVV